MNWCLRVHGLPFTITLTHNKYERRQYLAALNECKRQASYMPFAVLIFRVVWNAWRECDAFTASHAENLSKDYILNSLKRKSRSDVCSICLERNPHVAQVCCGALFHVHCVYKWQSQNDSCPHCRAQPDYPVEAVEADEPAEAVIGRATVPSWLHDEFYWSSEESEESDSSDDALRFILNNLYLSHPYASS